MTSFNVFYSMLLLLYCGHLILKKAFREEPLPWSLHVGLAFGLGIGILSQWMLILGMAAIPYNSLVISSLFIAIIIGLQFGQQEREKTSLRNSRDINQKSRAELPITAFLWIAFAYVAFNIFLVFWLSLNIPISEWDAFATISFKAKVIFYERSITYLRYFPHASYPLLTPFSQAWVAFNEGRWDDQWIKVIFPCVYTAFLCIFYGFLKQYLNLRAALVGIVLIISSRLFTYYGYVAYRDLLTAYYECGAIILLFLWLRQHNSRYLFMAGLFGGFLTFTKVEGQAYWGFMLLMLAAMLAYDKGLALRKKVKSFAAFALPGFIIWLNFFIYKISLGIHEIHDPRARIEIGWQTLARLGPTAGKILIDLFLTDNWSFVWLLLILSLAGIRRRRLRIETKCLFLILGLHFLWIIFLSTCTASYQWFGGHLWPYGLPRLHLHFFPFAVALVVLLNRRFFGIDHSGP